MSYKQFFFVLLLISIVLICSAYAVKITNWRVSNVAVVVKPLNKLDTGNGTYPSISGIHKGTMIPNTDIIIQKIYTYPCIGTSGHSEYSRIWNSTWSIEASLNGYEGDWHNITFPESFVLKSGETYNYTIRTRSYPQIIHKKEFNAVGGKITCKEFVDANGRKYDNWIPAMKLC